MKKKSTELSQPRKLGDKKIVPVKQAQPDPVVVWPSDIPHRYGVSAPTAWRMERDGRLPPRDFVLGGKVIGWHASTLEAMERGEAPPSRLRAARS